MKAMLLNKITDVSMDTHPLDAAGLPTPEPKNDELLIKVHTCGVLDQDVTMDQRFVAVCGFLYL